MMAPRAPFLSGLLGNISEVPDEASTPLIINFYGSEQKARRHLKGSIEKNSNSSRSLKKVSISTASLEGKRNKPDVLDQKEINSREGNRKPIRFFFL